MDTMELLVEIIKSEIAQLDWLAKHPVLIQEYEDSISRDSISIKIKFRELAFTETLP